MFITMPTTFQLTKINDKSAYDLLLSTVREPCINYALEATHVINEVIPDGTKFCLALTNKQLIIVKSCGNSGLVDFAEIRPLREIRKISTARFYAQENATPDGFYIDLDFHDEKTPIRLGFTGNQENLNLGQDIYYYLLMKG